MSIIQQKALYLDKPFGEWVIKSKDIPKPGQGEVLVKIAATALNPADWKIQTFGAPFISWPFLGGLDGAGIVEEVGAEVTSVAKGAGSL